MPTKNKSVVGLFGTCDNIAWRDIFIEQFKALTINYFNPMVDDWDPSFVDIENHHFQHDSIILFPVLGESLGLGSLGEIGFSINNVITNINNGHNQKLVVLIDDECTDASKPKEQRDLSNKTRVLVKSKLLLISHPNIFVIDTLDQMLDMVIKLYNNDVEYTSIREQYNIA
jgi:hypothetical protein